MRGVNHRVGLGLAIALGLLAAATNVQAQDPEPEQAMACEVEVAEAVSVSEEPVVLEASYTEAIGEALSAVLQEESGVQLVSAEPGAEEQSVRLTLDTSQAVSGEWTVSLMGESGECTGTFTVSAAGDSPAH